MAKGWKEAGEAVEVTLPFFDARVQPTQLQLSLPSCRFLEKLADGMVPS